MPKERFYPSYLKHHGIKGQKWGLRRFQNDDGTLNDAGKARYYENGKKKTAYNMTDNELNKSNQRLSAERQFNSLSGKNYKNPGVVKSNILKIGGSFIASALVVGGGHYLKEAIKSQSLKLGKASILKSIEYGLLAGSVAAVTSAATSAGAQVNTNLGGISKKQEK